MENRTGFVRREKEYRRRALEALYDKWRDSSRRENEVVVSTRSEIADLLRVTDSSAVRVLEYLEKRGLAELVGEHWRISLAGMDVVETPGRLNEVLPLH
jgi:ribosomal protein S25